MLSSQYQQKLIKAKALEKSVSSRNSPLLTGTCFSRSKQNMKSSQMPVFITWLGPSMFMKTVKENTVGKQILLCIINNLWGT